MWWARVLIFGIPLAVLSAGSWVAWQARMERMPRADELTVMLPGALPALNPFQPATEAERQMLDLMHEPLLRLNREGRPSPALAEQWQWHRRVTCWFATADLAQQAAKRLQALSGNPWVASQLEAASADKDAVTMRFVRPDDPGAEEALRTVADLKPVQLALLQVRPDAAKQALLRRFAEAKPDLVKRIWFDGTDTFELVATLPAMPFQQALASWLRERQGPPITVRPLGELTGLVEPVLEFRLRSGALWHDGHPVTAEDVRATLAWVTEHPEAAPSAAEAFQQVQRIDAAGADRVRVIYRTLASAALASWIDFPILPAAWLQNHPPPWTEPPPGAGPFVLKAKEPASILLERKDHLTRRIRLVPSASALKTRAGLLTDSLDVIWPGSGNETEVRAAEGLELRAAPARNRLLVLWNTRSPVLTDSRVRQALALATDRRALVEQLLQGRGRLVEGLFPPQVWFNQKHVISTTDLARAQELLAEAGWQRDADGLARKAQRTLDVELVIAEGNPWRRRLAEALARQWTRVGTRVIVTDVAAAELIDSRLRPGHFGATLLGLDFDMNWDQRLFWHSSARRNGMNFSAVADAQLDLLLDALAAEYDPDRVAARAREMEDRLLLQHAFLPLFSDLQEVALRKARFPHLPNHPAGLRLRDLVQSGAAGNNAPSSVKMILPDE